MTSPKDRQGMARNLFEYLIYDLDTWRIMDFRLKPWVDRFLILRASLYELESGEMRGEKKILRRHLKACIRRCPIGGYRADHSPGAVRRVLRDGYFVSWPDSPSSSYLQWHPSKVCS